MTHHVQFPPYLPRGKTDGEPHVLAQTVPGIEHHVLAVVQRILHQTLPGNGNASLLHYSLLRSPTPTPARPSALVVCTLEGDCRCPSWIKSGSRRLGPIMSALPPKADIRVTHRHVCFGPCVDGSGLARRIFTLQHWSEQPCVRPVCAVLMTAGHNALRGSGPGQ